MSSIMNDKFKELFVPTLLIVMALNVTEIIDSAFVSTFVGPTALAAIQLLEPIVILVTVFEWLFGLGGQILSLNKKAEFDEDGSNVYFTVAIFSTILLCILMLVVCSFNTDALISILHGPHDVVPYVKQYAPFLFLCFPLSTFLTVISQFIRVDGQPKFSSAIIIIANIINIVLDFIFLYYFKMGVSGAALASLIGYFVGVLCVSKYYLDSKRTFKFIHSIIPIRSWLNSFLDIIKTGFPSASMGLFDLILVYVMNRILIEVLGKIGLVAYSISVDSALIISILIIGIGDTVTSIIPLYYSQNDYGNVKRLVYRALRVSVICSAVFALVIWIWPQGFLMFYNLNNLSSTPIIINALKLTSIGAIVGSIATILIFYYESIDQAKLSTIMSVIAALFGPLLMVFLLYPSIGNNAIWLSTAMGALLSVVVAFIYVKINQGGKSELKGMLFINEDLIEKSRSYALINKNSSDKGELFNYLKSLNVLEYDLNHLNLLLDKIFDENSAGINVEVLVIDYDDRINVNIKDGGKGHILDEFKKEVDLKDNVKYSQALGFNNIDFTINKAKE